MAGGSQDLLQPNNLALSWCKYTSIIPSLTKTLSLKGSPQCCPGPGPLSLNPLPFFFSYAQIHTPYTVYINTVCDAHVKIHTICVRYMLVVPSRASVQLILVEGARNIIRQFDCIIFMHMHPVALTRFLLCFVF